MRPWKLFFLVLVILFLSLFILIPINNDASPKYALNNNSNSENELLKIDREFSDKSYRDGIIAAFLTYASEKAIVIREKHFPINGKKELTELYESKQSIDDKLSWTPAKAEISKSGELGYTYGEWNYINSEKNVYPLEKHGYYVTVWKKNQDDKWNFVMYIGNSTKDNLIQFRKLN